MSKLPKFTLMYNEQKERWDLKNEGTKRVIKTFETKLAATKGGILEKAVGRNGGSVKIKKTDGKIQEERTFPASQDPRKSKG